MRLKLKPSWTKIQATFDSEATAVVCVGILANGAFTAFLDELFWWWLAYAMSIPISVGSMLLAAIWIDRHDRKVRKQHELSLLGEVVRGMSKDSPIIVEQVVEEDGQKIWRMTRT